MTPRKLLQQILDEGREAAQRALDPDAAARLPGCAQARFDALEPVAPRFRSRINKALFITIVPLLALYEALRHDLGLTEEPALALAEEMLGASFARAFGPLEGVLWNAGFNLVPLRNLAMKRVVRVDEPGGFRFELAKDSTADLAFDVLHCPIAALARERGAPEIVPLICRLDDVMAGRLRRLSLQRTGTIGMGAARCDFRYVRRERS